MKDLDVGILAFLALAVIVAACRVVGWLGRRFLGQSQVVGEMIAGVALGPSLLGHFLPQVNHYIFPTVLAGGGRHPSVQVLYVICQVGLSLYMFLVGVEFDGNLLKSRAKGAVFVSLSGIIVPFALGALIAFYINGNPTFFPANIPLSSAVMYLGASMCITAFPMLARIIVEKGIAGTGMGTLALAAGATDDVFAWTLLAVVLAITKNDPKVAIFAIGGGITYALFMLLGVKHFFKYLNDKVEKAGKLDPDTFAIVLGVLMIGSWFTDFIGIYAVFGAFICGAAMPKGMLGKELKRSIEPLTVALFLPVFFIFSGINTRIDMLNTPYMWMIGGIVTLAAIIGKGAACTLAAKATGEPWRESLAIGTLMNSRGLMELIIVNIGLANHVITQEMFTVLVLMAIVTTLMASPLFSYIMDKRGVAVAPESVPVG